MFIFFIDRKTSKTVNCQNNYQITQNIKSRLETGFVTEGDFTIAINGVEKKSKTNLKPRQYASESKKVNQLVFQSLEKSYKVKILNSNPKYEQIYFFPSQDFDIIESQFDIISDCLNKNFNQFADLPSKLVFAKELNENYLNEFLVFNCSTEVKVKVSNQVYVKYFNTENNQEKTINIGKIDKNDEFIRRNGKMQNVEILKDYQNYPKINKLIIYQKDETNSYEQKDEEKKEDAERLFTSEGIKNDYLQTCKNSDGKTLFDVFKG